MIDRTVAQQAWAAEDGRSQNLVRADRACRALVGRAEDRDDPPADRRGQMHRAGVVLHEHLAATGDSCESGQARPADEIHDARGRVRRLRAKPRFDLTRRLAIVHRADNDAGRAAIADEPRGDGRHAIGRPALGVAVRGARRECDQPRIRRDAVPREQRADDFKSTWL